MDRAGVVEPDCLSGSTTKAPITKHTTLDDTTRHHDGTTAPWPTPLRARRRPPPPPPRPPRGARRAVRELVFWVVFMWLVPCFRPDPNPCRPLRRLTWIPLPPTSPTETNRRERGPGRRGAVGGD